MIDRTDPQAVALGWLAAVLVDRDYIAAWDLTIPGERRIEASNWLGTVKHQRPGPDGDHIAHAETILAEAAQFGPDGPLAADWAAFAAERVEHHAAKWGDADPVDPEVTVHCSRHLCVVTVSFPSISGGARVERQLLLTADEDDAWHVGAFTP